MEKYTYGIDLKGKEAAIYLLENKNGMKVEILDLGATVVKIEVPDKDGNLVDVVLGYEDVKGYEQGTVFLGAPVGRNANRIAKGQLTIQDVTYTLAQNNGSNNLHSGLDFYNFRYWNVEELSDCSLKCSLFSPDGDQGYPGNLNIDIIYTLKEDNTLEIQYHGLSDADTIFNMTNHSYFNLDGHASGNVLEQKIWLDSDFYTRADAESIPTGELLSVENTPMDFRNGKLLGEEIDADYEATQLGAGYDHNWVLKTNSTYQLIGGLSSEVSGIKMEVYTDLPGVQIYTGNFIDNEIGKNGVVYERRSGVCFETQYFPNAINEPTFEQPIIKAEKKYETMTAFKFMV